MMKRGERLPERKERLPLRKTSRREEIIPWRPSEFLQEMDRMFDEFRRNLEYMLGPIAPGWLRPLIPRFALPQMREICTDIIDAGAEYRICAELPGIPKENVSITVTPTNIEISAEAKTSIEEEKEGFVRQERGYSKLYRNLTFPEEVIPEKAEATLKDGLLEVRVAKKMPTEVKKHKVEVK
jgi:HSP20 family protein